MNDKLSADIFPSAMRDAYYFFNDLIDLAVFPIVATDESGIILYKNKAAARYLPMLRRGAAIERHICTPLGEGTTVLRHDTLYSRAAILHGSGGYHLIFFSRLQYIGGEEAAQEIVSRYTGEPAALFMDFLRMRFTSAKADRAPIARTDAELIRLFGARDLHENMRSFTPYALMQYLSARLSGAFRGLGYRLVFDIDDALRELPGERRVLTDFLFLFGRMIYTVMKLSSSGHVQIRATTDKSLPDTPVLYYSTDTALAPQEAVGVDAIKQFSALIPECAVEFAMLSRVPVFADGLTLSVDVRGRLCASQRIPLMRANELTVHAVSAEDPYLRTVSRLLVGHVKKTIAPRVAAISARKPRDS